MASGAELVLFRMWFVRAAPSPGPCEGGCPDLILLSGVVFFNLFSPSSRSVILVRRASKDLSCFFHVKQRGLSCLLSSELLLCSTERT